MRFQIAASRWRVESLRTANRDSRLRKREGVEKSMGNKVPWKTGMPIYLPVTSRPLISLQKEAVSSPCNFATAHLTALGDQRITSTSTERQKRCQNLAPAPVIISGNSLVFSRKIITSTGFTGAAPPARQHQ